MVLLPFFEGIWQYMSITENGADLILMRKIWKICSHDSGRTSWVFGDKGCKLFQAWYLGGAMSKCAF
jgi:hypothetical protein